MKTVRVTIELSDGTARRNMYHLAEGSRVVAFDVDGVRFERARECEFVIEDNLNETEGMGEVWFRCTSCNTCFDYYAYDWLLKQSYCPNCGARVVVA